MRFIGEIHENIILPRLLGKHLEAYSQTAWRPVKSLVRTHLRKAVNKPPGSAAGRCLQGQGERGVVGVDSKATHVVVILGESIGGE